MRSFPADELARRIDEVLFYIWDPIGVSPNPDARWEYRSYAHKVLEMVEAGEEQSKIASYLCNIESGMMAMSANEKKVIQVVELVYEHKQAIEEGRA